MLHLIDQCPFAAGAQRDVFIHPHTPEFVVKVARREALAKFAFGVSIHRRRTALFRQFKDTFFEIRSQLILMAQGDVPWRIARFMGFVDTDRGFGEVYELKKGRDGRPARTLREMLKEGVFDQEAEDALERFVDWLMSSGVTLKELHPGNLAYALADQRMEFVLIDGIGERGWFAAKSQFPLFNRLDKKRHVRHLRARIRRTLPIVRPVGVQNP